MAKPPATVSGLAPAPAQHCRNCGEQLNGDFCFSCGQKESNRNFRFSDFAAEFAEDIFVWESRIWRTLVPLVFRPGFLTAEFLAGRKVRYLPPVRLYLVLSFIMFLLISFSPVERVVTVDAGRSAEANQQKIEELEQRLLYGALSEEQKAKAREHLANHLEKGFAAELDVLIATEDGESTDISDATVLDFWSEGEKPAWAINLEQRLAANLQAIQADPGLFLDNFFERLPYIMFLLLPLFALLVKMAYLFSPFHYLQHLVFALHYHSAVFLFITLGMLVSAVTDHRPGRWVLLWCFIYLVLALVRVYGSTYRGALGKTLVITVSDAILVILTLSLLAVVSVVTL